MERKTKEKMSGKGEYGGGVRDEKAGNSRITGERKMCDGKGVEWEKIVTGEGKGEGRKEMRRKRKKRRGQRNGVGW